MLITRKRLSLTAASVLASVVIMPVAVKAQDFPSKPIRLIVPYAAGTATDILARQLSGKAGTIIGKPFVVENRAGANGVLGANSVARSAPDGYTLVFAANQTHATNAVLVRNLPYDPIKNFSPIVRLASQPQVLVVHPSLGVKSVAELIKLAKSKPGGLNFASTGAGTGAHLAGEFFKSAADIDIVHVPYSSAQVFTELLSGNTGMMFYPYAPLKPHIEAGKLVPLATTGLARAPWLPQLPTMIESGLNSFVMSSWFAIYGPSGMVPATVDKIAAAFRTVMEQADERAQMAATGTVPTYGGPQELADFTASEIERIRQVVTRAKISID